MDSKKQDVNFYMYGLIQILFYKPSVYNLKAPQFEQKLFLGHGIRRYLYFLLCVSQIFYN